MHARIAWMMRSLSTLPALSAPVRIELCNRISAEGWVGWSLLCDANEPGEKGSFTKSIREGGTFTFTNELAIPSAGGTMMGTLSQPLLEEFGCLVFQGVVQLVPRGIAKFRSWWSLGVTHTQTRTLSLAEFHWAGSDVFLGILGGSGDVAILGYVV